MSKKTFKNEINPALQFISTSTDEKSYEQEPQAVISKNVPIKRNPFYIETKSKRLQLLIQPSLHSKLKEMSEQKGTSLNELIHTILENFAKKSK